MSQWKPEVKFSGYPKPDIKWTKDEDLIESDNRCKIYVDETTSTIAIYSVERKDTGTYAIKASNSAGSAYLQLSLRVIGKRNLFVYRGTLGVKLLACGGTIDC
ncbi:hypothetical protein LSTR_LSTR016040 [Laodelphax striatellus]|uniref:Ig-like domain-containing protein n=1 Tax=Laodelphax striatellus TaxID=195883 RepID=A0A482XEK1_LAOST|nr:hypothetical protein LSTR_LSTR016040 [Laodelphax striatellus]